MEEFNKRLFSPMLFYESLPFDSTDYLYELKFDGIRCFAYLTEDKTALINKRGKDITNVYPELTNLHENIKSRLLLDGELVIMIDGKPNFYQLQKRSLMTNDFKIKLLSQKYPVTFVAFDLLILGDEVLIEKPLLERKALLQENVKEANNLLISRYLETSGIAFYQLAKEKGLEGIVAKEKNSLYYPGKRKKVWLKFKVYQEDDLIICGYVPSHTGIKELILGKYVNNELTYQATIVTSKDKKNIMEFANDYPNRPLFEIEKKDIVWMVPHLVGRVQYMMKSNKGGLRQAVFLGLRLDKIASDLKE